MGLCDTCYVRRCKSRRCDERLRLKMSGNMEYTLVPIWDIPVLQVTDMWMEFKAHGETCNVLYMMESMKADEFMLNARDDPRTYIFPYIERSRFSDPPMPEWPIGVGRVTPNLNHIENGNIGFAIRPTERGKGHAFGLITLLEHMCLDFFIESPTACADLRNHRSLRALLNAGWIPTGKIYDWYPNPEPRKAIEFTPGRGGEPGPEEDELRRG